MVFPGNHHREHCDRWRKLKALVGYFLLVIRAEVNLQPSGQKTALLPINVRGLVGWGNTALGTKGTMEYDLGILGVNCTQKQSFTALECYNGSTHFIFCCDSREATVEIKRSHYTVVYQECLSCLCLVD